MRGLPTVYTQQQLDYISQNRTLPRKQLHERFCKKFSRTDASQANLHSLCKRNKWLTGRDGRYQKGNIPSPNAGPKGPNKTSFKKGLVAHNLRVVGSERISKDGYIEIKVSSKKGNWSLKHRVVWEKHHGKLKPSDIVRFKDSDPLNCHISNLEKFNRAEHMELNRLNHKTANPDIKPTIAAIARVTVKTSQLRKDSA